MSSERKDESGAGRVRRWKGIFLLGFVLGAIAPWLLVILGAKLAGIPPYTIQIVVPDMGAAAPARVREIRLDERALFVRYRRDGLWISAPTYADRLTPTLHVEIVNADGTTTTHALSVQLPLVRPSCIARLDVHGGVPRLAPCEVPFLISSLRAFLDK